MKDFSGDRNFATRESACQYFDKRSMVRHNRYLSYSEAVKMLMLSALSNSRAARRACTGLSAALGGGEIGRNPAWPAMSESRAIISAQLTHSALAPRIPTLQSSHRWC